MFIVKHCRQLEAKNTGIKDKVYSKFSLNYYIKIMVLLWENDFSVMSSHYNDFFSKYDR